ncbi:hypothetical protein IWT25_02399 [Secundilactobacillus pentosiphilus]|uniref:HTH cro/C1-type domain-containing protein n=1 Tax=Secundilactobacillus pentosiphilus TaxID=1714682 RepID=A0A1Z5IZZ4_9LACO|nr:helix-turn-helix domain-containing protein [Secundilactobacillus pentosiphilus]GAX07051.1 hypothetical protein IWT25_02399 [Secundilactobacillus pentosiphilus]
MTESILDKYFKKNRLNANLVAEAAGLTRSTLKRQVNANFDDIKVSTIKMIANIMEQSPAQVLDDLYQLAGGINDYSDNAGIYSTDGGITSINLQQALKQVKQAVKDGTSLLVQGGNENDFIDIKVADGSVKYSFTDGTSDSFKAMWNEILGDGDVR